MPGEARTGLSRREFLATGAMGGAAVLVGVHLPTAALFGRGAQGSELRPAAWIRIDATGIVSVVVDEAEMGQGVLTSLPMIVADEMEADWSKIRALPPPEDPSTWVRSIATGGSTSIRTGWEPLRRAGAAARELLRQAAALEWDVPVAECRAENGRVIHGPTGRAAGFGDLVETASTLPIPEDPPLKPTTDLRIVGRSVARLDAPAKADGSAVFGTDVSVPGMRVAVVARAPAFGARLVRYEDGEARRVPGVVDVVRVPQGVAVIATGTWPALRGRQALVTEWDTGPARGLSSDTLFDELEGLLERPGTVERVVGDPDAALRAAATTIAADYRLPFLDHAPMEPMNAAAHVHDGRVEVWVPTQVATEAQRTAARVAGVALKDVVLHVTLIGGAFGRRLETDDVELAVEVARRVQGPVQVLWTREDSIRNGAYRPLTVHRLRAGLDAQGRPVAWTHRVAGAGGHGLVVPGAGDPPYHLPDRRADYHLRETPVPVGAWRSVSYTHMGFVIESFMDELAHAAGRDPFELRRSLLTEPRLRAALELAAERAGWGTSLPAGHGRGIAAVSSFASHVAEVAEVSVRNGQLRVHRITCGVHCGRVVNPDTLRAQVEGGVTLALGFTLKHGITLRDGAVLEGNFADYPLLRIDEMPEVEVHVVPSDEPPTGIGEPPVPPLAAAVANAVFAATGRRIRRLPIRTADLAG